MLAGKLGGRRITVNSIAPGPFEVRGTTSLVDWLAGWLTDECRGCFTELPALLLLPHSLPHVHTPPPPPQPTPGHPQSKMMAVTLERAKDEIVEGTVLGRIGSTEDMAGVSLFLASRAGAYVTGAVIVVDGGILCKPRL